MSESKSIYAGWIENKKKKKTQQIKEKKKSINIRDDWLMI
jgi:hypothetical protein